MAELTITMLSPSLPLPMTLSANSVTAGMTIRAEIAMERLSVGVIIALLAAINITWMLTTESLMLWVKEEQSILEILKIEEINAVL